MAILNFFKIICTLCLLDIVIVFALSFNSMGTKSDKMITAFVSIVQIMSMVLIWY